MAVARRGVIAAGLALAAGPGLARAAPLPAADGDMVLGAANARVQLVEYASLSCPHCAHWFVETFPRVRKAFIDTGQVRFVFREFLTPPPEFAAAGFLLARRVGMARYFEVLDAIFRRQTAIFESGDLWGGLVAVGQGFGLTEPQVAAALQDPKTLAELNARVAKAASRDHIEVTPTFFVNGVVLAGEATFDALSAAITTAARAKA